MKKMFLAIALLIGANCTSFAQAMQQGPAMQHQRPTAEQRAQMLTDKLDQNLHMTAQQKKTMYDTNLKLAQKMETAMQNHDRNALAQLRQERIDDYKKILTPEQVQKIGLDRAQAAPMQKTMMMHPATNAQPVKAN